MIQVTEHALQRARERYGLVNVDWLLIADDVRAAILAGRAGKTHPNGSGHTCRRGGIYAWTPNCDRIYVVDGARSRTRRFLRVTTALPGYHGEFSAYRRAA
jgi:hypothetical protein